MPRRRSVAREQLEVMTLVFVVGVINMFWVVALILFVLVEKIVRGGRLLRYAGGVRLILWGGTILRATVA
jgi:predicted metal-binding membrane protein